MAYKKPPVKDAKDPKAKKSAKAKKGAKVNPFAAKAAAKKKGK